MQYCHKHQKIMYGGAVCPQCFNEDAAKAAESLKSSPNTARDEISADIIESNSFCSYCTGSVDTNRCGSCDALTGDCFVGRKLRPC